MHGDALSSVTPAAKRNKALHESKLSLITFNSASVDVIRRSEIMETVQPLANDEYVCASMTPLFDAIGQGIGILDEAKAGKSDAKAILVVITDGMENDSRKFDRASPG